MLAAWGLTCSLQTLQRHVEQAILSLWFWNFMNALKVLENIFIKLGSDHMEIGDIFTADEGPIPLHNLHNTQPNKYLSVVSFPQLHDSGSSHSGKRTSKGTGSQTSCPEARFCCSGLFLSFSKAEPGKVSPPDPPYSPTYIGWALAHLQPLPLCPCWADRLCRYLAVCPLSPHIRQRRQQDPSCLVLLPPQGHLTDTWAWSWLQVKAMGLPRSCSWQWGGSSAETFILRRGSPIQPLAHSPELR